MSNGILLVDKMSGTPSFRLVSILRRLTGESTIGHAGTLDPFATGLMVMLIGRPYTKRSNTFLTDDKEYLATARLGISTDTYDFEGVVTSRSAQIPTLYEIKRSLEAFQGQVLQIPPMYSAKKVRGKKLYDLARKGIEIERQPTLVRMEIKLLRYDYPELEFQVRCSKGTYIRSLAHDLGNSLGCGAHLIALRRLASGSFSVNDAVPEDQLAERWREALRP